MRAIRPTYVVETPDDTIMRVSTKPPKIQFGSFTLHVSTYTMSPGQQAGWLRRLAEEALFLARQVEQENGLA